MLPSDTLQSTNDLNSPVPKRQFRYSGINKQALEENTQHQFAAQHSLSIYGSGSIYTYIPKNACSSLRYSIANSNGCVADLNEFEWIHKNNATFRASLSELLTANYSFVVLRCPYSRLASVFLDKIVKNPRRLVGLRNVSSSRNPGLDLLKKNTPKWLWGANQPNLERLSFRDFVGLLLQEGAVMQNHHYAPQLAFLVFKDYDNYFCVEDFGTASREISKRLGIEVADTRPVTRHGTSHLTLIDDRKFCDTEIGELAAMKRAGRLPTHSSLFDDELIDAAKRLYGDDINFYTSIFGASNLTF